MRPLVGCRNLVARLKTVVLPAPFGPISAWIEPRWTSSVRSRTAVKPRKLLVSPSIRSATSPGPKVCATAAILDPSSRNARPVCHRAGAFTNESRLLAGERRTRVVGERTEHVVALELRDQLGLVPLTGRIRRRLDLREANAVDHAAIRTQVTVVGEHVAHRRRADPGRYDLGVGRVGRLDGLEVAARGRVSADLERAGEHFAALDELGDPGLGLGVVAARPRIDVVGALSDLQAHGTNGE